VNATPDLDRAAPQGWGWAAVVVGTALILFSGLGHVVAWLYVSLAPANMSDSDTRLGLGVSITYAIVILTLAIFAVTAAGLGLREAARTRAGRGIAVAGVFLAIAGLIAWLMASANLLIVAIARLR
jgi:hypothetical protein